MKALVTGAGGFLGQAISQMLIGRGDTVRGFQRGHYPTLEKMGVEICQGDLADKQAIKQAVQGVDIVFHVAAKAGVWGAYQSYYQPNVQGTDNVIQACQQANIAGLVYTSSPSVVFDGHDENGLDESAPYPSRWLTHYAKTKAIAEQKIIAANTTVLRTVSLRPHLIWGPGDRHLVPRVIARAKAGRLRMLGKQKKKVDSTYIDNAARAHLLAGDELLKQGRCAGKAYFITNGEPIAMIDLLNRILKAADLPAVQKTISPTMAYAVGAVLEVGYRLLSVDHEPIMTRFVAKQLSTAHWFDISAAARDFDYHPTISIEQGMKCLSDWLLETKIV